MKIAWKVFLQTPTQPPEIINFDIILPYQNVPAIPIPTFTSHWKNIIESLLEKLPIEFGTK